MGAPNSKAATHAHESPWTMTLPISVLGIVYAIGAGFAANILIPHSSLQVVEKSLSEMAFHLTAPATIVGAVALILGYLSFKFYGLFVGQDSLQKISPRTYQVLEYRWMDTFYNWYIDKVQRRFAEFIVFLDLLVINGLAVRWIVGGTFAALGHVSSAIFHRGQTRAYAIWITLGSLLLIWFLLR
jgi:NADH-quinone oxidoreductase subunit L